MIKLLAESNVEIWKFEMSLWILSPIALICSLMFLAAMMSSEKYTSAGLFALLFRPKLLTKKGRRNQIGLWISSIPIMAILVLFGIRMLDLSVNEVTNVIRSESPDGSKALVMSIRERFPLDELFDPTISVRFSLIENKSAKTLNNRTLYLELSDLNEKPVIEWDRRVVKISSFDYRKADQVVTFSFDK